MKTRLTDRRVKFTSANARMGYAKLFSSITESSLWSEPKEVRLLFVTMLAKANSVGFVEASILGLARVANLSKEEVEVAVPILESPDPFSKNPDLNGIRIVKAPGGWMVLNYEDYRNRTSEEERREYMREYMRNYRKENGCKPSVNSVKKSKKKPYASAFVSESGKGNAKGKPSLEEAKAYGVEIGMAANDVESWYDHFESNGWKVGGKTPMRDWKAALRNGKRHSKGNNGTHQRNTTKSSRTYGTANERRIGQYEGVGQVRPVPDVQRPAT